LRKNFTDYLPAVYFRSMKEAAPCKEPEIQTIAMRSRTDRVFTAFSIPLLRFITCGIAVGALLLGGCNHAQLVSEGAEERDIEFGQTIDGVFEPMSEARLANRHLANVHTYRFQAASQERITVTVRSGGPDITLVLNKGYRPHPLGVGTGAFAAGTEFTLKPHAEILGVVPKSKKGEFSIEVRSREPGPYSVTLTQGFAPNLDLWAVPEPRPGSSGEFMSPFTTEGKLAPWMQRALIAGSSSTGRTLAESGVTYLAGTQVAGVVDYAIEQHATIRAAGGRAGIKADSDVSFDSLIDLALHLHLLYSNHRDYDEILAILYLVYPKIESSFAQVRLHYPRDDFFSL
jgi:hypothetical protein